MQTSVEDLRHTFEFAKTTTEPGIYFTRYDFPVQPDAQHDNNRHEPLQLQLSARDGR